jgi:hypothetical protein
VTEPHLPVVFNRRQALDAGYGRGQVARRVRAGAWIALRWGSYCRAADWCDASPRTQHRLRTLAALVSVGDATAPSTPAAPADGTGRPRPLTAVSHLSAACLFGWPQHLNGWGAPHLTTPRPDGRGRCRSGLCVHTATLEPDDVIRRFGVTITSPARTVADLLRLLPAAEAVAMADHALREGDVQHQAIVAALGRHAGWPHVAAARRALALVDPRRESWLESWSLVSLHEHGVPLPIPQARVLDEQGVFVARVDAYWPGHATVGEADGEVKYQLTGPYIQRYVASPDAAIAEAQRRLDAQRRRHERLLELGLRVVRWSAKDVIRDPRALAHRVAASLARGEPQRVRAQIVLPDPLPWTDSASSLTPLRE